MPRRGLWAAFALLVALALVAFCLVLIVSLVRLADQQPSPPPVTQPAPGGQTVGP